MKNLVVKIPDEMLAWLDAEAKKRAMSRSQFVRTCLLRVQAGGK